jgi:hypothetical protein
LAQENSIDGESVALFLLENLKASIEEGIEGLIVRWRISERKDNCHKNYRE